MSTTKMTRWRKILILGGALVFAGALIVAYVAYCFVFHTAENALAATACRNAVGARPSVQLAQLCLSVSLSKLGGSAPEAARRQEANEQAEQAEWFECVVHDEGDCGLRSAHVRGVLSALPNRYSVSVDIEDGVTTACHVSGAAGW